MLVLPPLSTDAILNRLCVACSAAATVCPAPCNWRLEQPPTAFDLEVIEHVNDAGEDFMFRYVCARCGDL